MKLIMNAINGEYLRDIFYKLDLIEKTDEVLAAVAYATDSRLLFDWCWKNKIPLKYYGRLDAGIAVSIDILDKFLNKSPANSVCKLVENHHAKVIWWRGYGVYIGSANLTGKAWGDNTVEAGCFFLEEEIDDVMKNNLFALFKILDKNATILNEVVIEGMRNRSKILKENKLDETEFLNNTSFRRWRGLVTTAKEKPQDRKREKFLKEWYDTLEYLKYIRNRVSLPENRPKWISDIVPPAVQADQFLHAYYYEFVVQKKKSLHEVHFEKNKNRTEEALTKAIEWWQDLPQDLAKDEDKMMNKTAPFLKKALSQEAVLNMDEAAFHKVCREIHASINYVRLASNISLKLPVDGTKYTIPQKIEALAKTIWNNQSAEGKHVKDLLNFILYDGTDEQLPKRLWQGFNDPTWKIKGLDVSSLGEIVGWARPDKFPPRNGRTSKALKSLGYNVKVHVG